MMAQIDERQIGTVRWYDMRKGFGFVAPDNGGEDVFLGQRALRHAGLRRLREGDRIEFAVTEGPKGLSAEYVTTLTAHRPERESRPHHPQRRSTPAARREAAPAPAPAPVVESAPLVLSEDFTALGLIEPLLRAVATEGYSIPTPIQEQAIPEVLAGRDLLGTAQTGTGKTAAFALPILQHLAQSPETPRGSKRAIRVLVLSPTRELATQIGRSFDAYGRFLPFKQTTIFGGVGQNPQVDALRRGVDILVATPGRLLDLQNQGYVRLDQVEILVLDEADQMLDMGFIHDVRKIVASVPETRQTLFFSATMPTEIVRLSSSILTNPAKVAVRPEQPTVEIIDQSVYHVRDRMEKQALLEYLLRDPDISRVLVFVRTKHGADRVVKMLARARISAEPIHGNRSQNAREKALSNFASGRTRVLVATDVAARGLDIDQISHVIQYDLPNIPETYVHRIGRTGRAGAAGTALAFCEPSERAYLRDIEKLIRRRIEVVEANPYAA